MPGDLESDIEAYAALVVELAEAANEKKDRGAVLLAHDLDERRWEAIDDAWQARLSAAADGAGEDEGVPALVIAYGAAFSKAQAARAPANVIPLEKFGEVMRGIQTTGDTLKSLERAGITLQQFLHANQYWTKRIVSEPELEARIKKLLR
jgi:hypothetical protein